MNQPQGRLIQSLGLFSAFILTVSSVIGSGVYKKVGIMSIELLSPGLVLLAWMLAGLISVCGALSNAEIASMLADSGGEYVYYRKIYNRFFAFLYGWTAFTVIRSASLASIAYVFSQSFNSLVPLPVLPTYLSEISIFGVFTPFDNFGVKFLTIALIAALSFVNLRGLKGGEGLSRIILILVVINIVIIIVLGLTIGGGSFENIQTNATGFVERPWYDVGLIKGMFAAMIGAFWAFEGWATTGYLGGEIKNPNRNLPLALVFGVLFVMLIYVSINFTYLFVLPIDQMVAVSKTENTIAAVEVVKHFLGGPGGLLISILILLTTFGATNTTALMPPRLYYSMAREQMFFKSAAYIHPKYNTPSKAFIIQGIWASILVLSGSFEQLTDMLIFASFIFYGSTTLGVFILRYKMPDAPRPYKAWGYPVVPALFILFCMALVAITLMERPREALLGLGLMVTGVPFYLYWKKKIGVTEQTTE
ncbi:MAG: amino acid permease [Cyclobacteriaceae bacterium]|nr:amino acid permease [Cyclobacteriaceae bacterium]